MNKHIELVKKWLSDPDSVTQEELNANSDDAADAAEAARDAARAAWNAADARTAAASAAAAARDAAYWVKKYKEMTGE